jgi:tape measure domain-containing protein
MNNLNYKMTLDNEDFKKKFAESRNAIKQSGNEAERVANQISNSIKKAGALIPGVFSVIAVQRFAKEVVNVRAEIELLEASFETLVGSGYKKFLDDLKAFAVESPLSLTGVSKAAQTLLGFGIETEKVIPIVKQLGDISMGNEQRFSSLALAFAQMSSAGKLMGQDLLQMVNAGFNPLTEISRKTGKSIGDLRKEMEQGAISAEMVADAFRSVTEEGGKFYGMTEKQAAGIKGLQNQLQGVIQETLNKIGKDQQGLIAGGYKAVIMLVESYEEVGKVLASIVAVYGTYRAALIAHNVATIAAANAAKGLTIAEQLRMRASLASLRVQQQLNKAMLTNPYVLAATVVAALGAAIYLYTQRATAAERATKTLKDQLEDQKQKTIDERNELQNLISTLKDETSTRHEKEKAFETLQKLMPSIFKDLDIEKAKTIELTTAAREYNEQLERKNYLENKQKVETAQQLLGSKEGDWRWTVKERQQALSLMGKNSSRWNVLNTAPTDIISEFREWVKQADRAVKDYEISFVKQRLGAGKSQTTTTTPTTDTEKEKKAEYDATLEIMQAGVDAMIDGYDKQQAQILVNHEKRIEDIRKRGQELSNEEQKILTSLSGQQYKNELEALNNEVLNKYQSYADEKLAIEEKFENQRKEIIKRSNVDNADQSARALTALESERNTALQQLSDKAVKNNEEFQKFVDSVVGLSLTELQRKLMSVWFALKTEIARNGQTENAAFLKAQYDELVKLTLNLRSESEKPINERGWSNTIRLMRNVQQSINGITSSFDGLNDSARSVLDAAANVAGGVISMITSVELLGKTGVEAIKGVERASVILAVISTGIQVLQKIFSLFSKNNELSQQTIKQYDSLMSVTDDLISKQMELMATMSGVNAAIEAQQALLMANKQIEASRNLGVEYMNSGETMFKSAYGYRNYKEIKKYAKDIERVLGISFDSLGTRLTGLFNLSGDQLKELQSKLPLVWAKLDNETRKYLQNIIDGHNKIDEINRMLKESTTGISFDDALNSFDNFLMSVDKGLEDTTSNFSKYMKNAILRSIKDSYLNNALKSWYENFNQAMTDNELTENEKTSLESQYKRIAEEAKKRMDALMKSAGIDREEQGREEQGQATYGAYEKITQDQADRIDGKLTGIHMNTTQILEANKGIKSVSDETYKLIFIQVEHLENIKKNTALLNKTNEILDKIDKNTRNL